MNWSHISLFLSSIPVWMIASVALIVSVIRLALVKLRPAAVNTIELLDSILIAGVLVYMIILPFVMKSFYIPSGSMRPTLIDDDHLLCNKILYRFQDPQREDVVIFVAPQKALLQSPEGYHPEDSPVDYIKRLIGLPGDIIVAHHGYISVNGDQKTHDDIRQAFNIVMGADELDQDHVKIEKNDLAVFNGIKWTNYSAAQVAQQFGLPGAPVVFHPGVTIRNGKVLDEPYTAEDPAYDLKIVNGHSVWQDPDEDSDIRIDGLAVSPEDQAAAAAAKPSPVPPGCLFVMGDNRNDSGDSTHWGPLERGRLVGKAAFIFYPFNRVRPVR